MEFYDCRRHISHSHRACVQLLLFKRQARDYRQAGQAQRALQFQLRRLRLEERTSDSLLCPRPGRNFWCPNEADWREPTDISSEVRTQLQTATCISYCLEQSEPESAVIVLSRASSAFCFVLVFATRFNMMQYVLAKALVHSHLTAATASSRQPSSAGQSRHRVRGAPRRRVTTRSD